MAQSAADFLDAKPQSAADFLDASPEGSEESDAETGAAETVLHSLSTIPASLGGGLAYVGTLATTANPEAAESVRQDTQNALTYEPRTVQGRAATDVVDAPINAAGEKYGELTEKVGQGTAEQTGIPLLGALEKAGLNAIPMLAGYKAGRTGIKYERVPGYERGAEPTPPSSPGGYPREDFAPKIAPTPELVTENVPAPPEAPTPPQTSGPHNPVPGKPHIRPKAAPPAAALAVAPAITPQATPSAQEATPSAAPDHAGNPPPDTHDPNFFPAPDNQNLKSGTVSPAEQDARAAAVERGAPTLQQHRTSAITNNYADQGRDFTGYQAKDPAAVAQIAGEGQALHTEARRISQGTGGQMGVGESADAVRDKAYQDWHDTTVAALNRHIDATYAAEDAQAKQVATPGSNLKGALQNDSLIDSQNATHVRSSTMALARNMGVDLTDPHAQMNAWQLEQIRKHAGNLYPNAPRLAQAIKDATEADMPQGAYVRARALRTLKGQMFDNVDGINRLGASKDIDPDTGLPRSTNRPVKNPTKEIAKMDPGQVAHIVRTMKRSSTELALLGDHEAAKDITDKAHRAAQQLQSHFTEHWIDEAGKGGGWNTKRAHQYLRNNQETLNAIMRPEQLHQIRNVNNAANVLDLDKGYKGSFAQFTTGAHWLRQRLGRTAEGVITDLIPMGNTIGEMTGLSEKARQILGGPSVGVPPKDFTRPLGARVAGGKMRGAVGDLRAGQKLGSKYPVLRHEYDPDSGEHTVYSPNGTTVAHDAGKDIVVSRSDTTDGATGRGENTARTSQLADTAHARGGVLRSDVSISPGAAGSYEKMKNQGYTVIRNPGARINPETGNIVSDDPRRPVYTVGPKAPPQAPARPLGETLFGGKQRGAIGNLSRKAEPEGPAMVNIGLHVNGGPAAGGSVLDSRIAKASLKAQGVDVGKTSIQNPEGGEPTLVANINRPLTLAEGNALAKRTGQTAIAQRHTDGTGTMLGEGAQSAEAKKNGWDKYNSDYFQMHDGRSATEHDAEAKGFNEVKPHLTPAEVSDIENRAPRRRTAAIRNLLDTFHGSTSIEGTGAMALAGQAKKGWYQKAGKAINSVFGPDAPRFTALLAAMSPQTSVEINFHNAIRTFINWDKAGRPTDPVVIRKIMEDSSLKNPNSESESNIMDVWYQNGVRALTSENPEHESFQLSGPKVNSFFQNLRGHTHEVTNDSWIAIATNIDQKLFSGAYRAKEGDIFGRMGFKSPTYMGVSAKIRAAALQLSKMTGERWSPAEVQETMWSFVKTAFEHAKATGKSIPELLKSGELSDKLIHSTSDFHSLFGAPEHQGFLDDSRFGEAARRVASESDTQPAPAGKKSAAAAKILRPNLEAEAGRLEEARQARLVNRKARIGNIQVPF